MSSLKPLALIISLALLSGCATVMSGTTQSITVVTEKGVEGANCELTDKKGGKWFVPSTPGTATVRKGDGPMSVVCKKDGYKTATLLVDETVTGATFGNIILGGGIGVFVDIASGAAQHYPDKILLWMEPNQWTSEADRIAWLKGRETADAAQKPAQEADAGSRNTSNINSDQSSGQN